MNNSFLKELDSKTNLLKLINSICNKYTIDPSVEQNIINIKYFLKPLDSRLLLKQYKTVDAVNNYIIDQYGKYINSNNSVSNDLQNLKNYLVQVINTPGDDVSNINTKSSFTVERLKKERLKKERLNNSLLSSFMDADEESKFNIVKYLNYDSLLRDEYIIIDSRYRNTTNTDYSKIVFNLQTNVKASTISNTNQTQSQGGIIIGTSIKDIVQIELFPFTIPYNPSFDNFYNKITLTINEWISNSYQAFENGQFHFILDIVKIENNLIYLKPIDNIFRFVRPVNYIDNFTLSFGAMLPKITFDNDRLQTSNIDYTSVDGIITFNEKHKLITGDLVYITNFTTPDPALDADFINEINRTQGHIIVKKNDYSIIINMDMTEIRHTDPIGSQNYPIDSFIQTIAVYFASKRIVIPLRIKHLIQSTPI